MPKQPKPKPAEISPQPTAAKPPVQPGPSNALRITRAEGETDMHATARGMLEPAFRHATATAQLHAGPFGQLEGLPGIGDLAGVYGEIEKSASEGDLAFASRMLATQAVTLDNIFAEMARRMANNIGKYPAATESYARMALKAQTNCRTTLEALAKLHQPREQTVRHIHVNEGGQAVIAEEFHHHAGGAENGQATGQPHEP